MAWRVEEELAGLQQRIVELLEAGWIRVQIVTDHGWLVLPGGLPKAELPKHLMESRWGRCAIPSAGAQHGYPMISWFWDAAEAIVLAPGVSCFLAGMEYVHGGLTLQESLIPSVLVSAKQAGNSKTILVKEIKWAGMRLNVVLVGAQGLAVDIRRKVADASSSLVATPGTGAADNQRTSLLVIDDETMGEAAFLVVMDENGQSIFKHSVIIGEN